MEWYLSRMRQLFEQHNGIIIALRHWVNGSGSSPIDMITVHASEEDVLFREVMRVASLSITSLNLLRHLVSEHQAIHVMLTSTMRLHDGTRFLRIMEDFLLGHFDEELELYEYLRTEQGV